MPKLLLAVICIGASLVFSNGAYAKGSAVVFHMQADHAPFPSATPAPQGEVIIRWSPQHHHYHRIYLPQAVSHRN
jgi:hypothetical protein